MAGERSYLDRVAAVGLEGVDWTRERIGTVRDLLARWRHLPLPRRDGVLLVASLPRSRFRSRPFPGP